MITPAEGTFRLDDEAASARLGAAIGRALEAGEAVCLAGPLGAGKSVMARGLVRALAPSEGEIPSPTFTLVQFYPTELFTLAHFDLYRLTSPQEAYEIGLDEALREGSAVIEWPERLGHHQPPNRLDVEIEVDGEARRARLTPEGSWEGRPLEL
ncbi:MAG TPA: tRNA (adenosine(37)-N6)-threonylcarbamoyltransferase complex ATPase subunit type 1 TsaE [Caulobacteraceae bacterium]|jgi:tRNA threonylcarbamoyladenosine biosynthesis protein TsaE|nr:tRNA (adenosine(37)-N6)-threonylcarbamoyltransferase complex ATPase subunit type 1 TsaE [Caulobacteraceae bacterium]